MPEDSSTDSKARGPDLDALAGALDRLGLHPGAQPGLLQALPDTGLAHDHLRVAGTGLLLRVPKQSQFALAAAENLAYQAACFARVSESGHGPRLHGKIEPQERLPMGALVVDYIEGRPPRLPDELPALAAAMARVHALALPEPAARPPLEDHANPVAGAMAEIEAQAEYLEPAGLEADALAEIEAELTWARDFAADVASERRTQPVSLVLTDTHPGNFLITPAGRAVIVDLEKALYGSPGIDLAHATVYSSTTWDVATYAELSVEEVADFYHHYLDIVTESAGAKTAAALRPWLVPMRRILFLRAITWCAKWRVAHAAQARRAEDAPQSAEDWSAEKSDPALIAHVKGRTDEYLSAPTLRRMRAEWLGEPGLDELIG